MQPSEYTSIERVLLLLILLNNAPAEGYAREEIFAQIPLYDAKGQRLACSSATWLCLRS